MRIYPAIHYTMGGLWVDYNLMSTVPGLHVLGEANFSDHGANRLGASALMQGLADGYFVIPYTIGDYLANSALPKVTTDHDAFKDAAHNAQAQINKLLSVKGNRGIREIHRELGRIMWDDVGMARTDASLKRALSAIPKLREEFWHNVSVPGSADNLNQSPSTRRVATTSSSPSCWRSTRSSGANRPAATSGKRARRPTAKRCATTSIIMSRLGSSRAWREAGAPPGAVEFHEVHPSQRSYKVGIHAS
jgi:aspartate oxidase